MTTSDYTSKDLARFWSKVNKNGSVPKHCPELGACWKWIGKKNSKGYGGFKHKNQTLAHRVSWEIEYGEIPNKLFVLHKCDTPDCVNPSHLFLGTLEDNNRDRHLKGRDVTWFGIRHGSNYKKHP